MSGAIFEHVLHHPGEMACDLVLSIFNFTDRYKDMTSPFQALGRDNNEKHYTIGNAFRLMGEVKTGFHDDEPFSTQYESNSKDRTIRSKDNAQIDIRG